MTQPPYRLSIRDQQLLGIHAAEIAAAQHAVACAQNVTETLRAIQKLVALGEYWEDVIAPKLERALDLASIDYRDERRAREGHFNGLRAA